MQILTGFEGIATRTALGLIAEIGDFSRFSHPRELCSWLGIVPSEYSSGQQRHRGHITRTGNRHARHALASSGSAYVIDFPVTHLSSGSPGRPGDPIFERSKSRFIAAWSERYWFLYVPTTVDVIFVSRSKILRRLFGSKYGVRLCW